MSKCEALFWSFVFLCATCLMALLIVKGTACARETEALRTKEYQAQIEAFGKKLPERPIH